MMFTWDKDFEDALATPEALEKHLAKLVKQRRWCAIVAGGSAAVCFFNIFVIIWASWKRPGQAPGALVAVSLTMLVGIVQQTGSALAAQADIRTLKAYKKTLELVAARQSPP